MSRYVPARDHGTRRDYRTRQPVAGLARRMHIVRETLVILFGALLYFWVRGLMETRASLAFANAESLIALEQRLALFHEPWMQGLIIESEPLVTLFNRIYIFGHWPVIAMTMVWLIWRHSDQFGLYRSALLISGAIGLACFVLMPMAPPRFMSEYGFIDTVTQRSNAYRVLQPPAFTNQFAAMPSLHVGWNLLMGIAIVRHSSSMLAHMFGVLMPLVMFVATIVTANHYILDGVVGSLIALVGLGIAWQLRRPSLRLTPRRSPSSEMSSAAIGPGSTFRQVA